MDLATPRVLFDSWLVTIYDPSTISANFHSLEVVFLLGFVLTLRHALSEYKCGHLGGLILWLTALMYGVLMEVLSYNTVDNFTHAQFTVQFYHHQLPFYVVLLYPTFIYTAVLAARKLKAGPVATFFAAGLLAVLLDVPFDIMGPDCGWWAWHTGGEDPWGLVAHRWLGVPVSSYCWHLLFTGALASVTAHYEKRATATIGRGRWFPMFARALPVTTLLGLLSIVMGILVMMPFHLFRALGFTDGVFTVTLFATAGLFVLTTPNREPASRVAQGIFMWVLVWYAYYLLLGPIVWSGGGFESPELKATIFGLVATVALTLHRLAHLRRA